MRISSNSIRAGSATLAVVAIAIGCASTTSGTRPDDMSARQHREQSQAHASAVQRHAAKYDRSKDRPRGFTRGSYESDVVHNPTAEHRHHAREHRSHADQHAAAAAELERFTAAECREVPLRERSACPLLGGVKRVENIEGGARLVFASGVPTDSVLEHMRCHQAFGREQGRQGMDQCPLYVHDIRIDRAADGRSVTITSENPKSVELVRQRARAQSSGGAEASQ